MYMLDVIVIIIFIVMVIFIMHFISYAFYILLSLACISMLIACDKAPENVRKEVHSINQKITPNAAEQVNMTYILAGLKNKGFDCKPFNNAVKQPMVFCSRIKNKDNKDGKDNKEIITCSDSIWIEHDGQNHVLSNQQFYECDNQHKMVITRKN